MTYQESVDIINSLLVFGSKPGLERVQELCERLGSPHKRLRFVHVAGTNGKGSVCAYLARILQEAGFKTGLFISPYVLEFRERFQINGQMIPPQELADIVEQVYPVVLQMKAEDKIITEFEMVLAVALCWYAKEQCDVVVLETGLGGRFDATNIIPTPLASVIMSISLDHTAVLGDTVEKIAFEKCGIIKPQGVTVLYGDQPQGVEAVVRRAAAAKNNRLVIADTASVSVLQCGLSGTEFSFRAAAYDGEPHCYRIPLLGQHQLNNAAAALYTVAVLRQRGLSISEEAVIKGLASTQFPARLELLQKEPPVLLDGAHNPGGGAALAAAVQTYLSGYRKIAVVGMLADKDVRTVLGGLLPLFDEVITLTPPNPRAMSAGELAELVRSMGIPAEPQQDYRTAVNLALHKAQSPDTAVVAFGSLYLASSLRPLFIEAAGQAEKQ